MRRLHDLVSNQALATPDATALVFGDQSVSYAELDRASSRLANLILENDCSVGSRICLLAPKGINAVIGMLSTLKAGCVYVPIDLDSPMARLQKIVDECEFSMALIDSTATKNVEILLGDLREKKRAVALNRDMTAFEILGSSDGSRRLDELSTIVRDAETCASDPAHILFTSGSTGSPKGVVITHQNVVSFLDWATSYFQISAGERISGHAPLYFDLSTFDIYGALSRGATLYMVPPTLNLMANKVADFIRSNELDQWFSVPSLLTYMAQFDVVRDDDFPALKRLIWCGEVLPTRTLIYWMKRLPHVTFTNLYGPTEATIASSYYTVERCPENGSQSIPIGTACAGEELLLLDEQLEQTSVGDIGEIYIGGSGLSPGYWRDEGKTAAVFISRSGSTDVTDRIYRTGDLGLVGDDGLMYYLGRVDSQIKSRGHRIELGEIETALNDLDYLAESAAVGVDLGGFEGTTICCAYATTEETTKSPNELRRDLAKTLPSYMLPTRWSQLEALPKNANGKVDRREIREQFLALDSAVANGRESAK